MTKSKYELQLTEKKTYNARTSTAVVGTGRTMANRTVIQMMPTFMQFLLRHRHPLIKIVAYSTNHVAFCIYFVRLAVLGLCLKQGLGMWVIRWTLDAVTTAACSVLFGCFGPVVVLDFVIGSVVWIKVDASGSRFAVGINPVTGNHGVRQKRGVRDRMRVGTRSIGRWLTRRCLRLPPNAFLAKITPLANDRQVDEGVLQKKVRRVS